MWNTWLFIANLILCNTFHYVLKSRYFPLNVTSHVGYGCLFKGTVIITLTLLLVQELRSKDAGTLKLICTYVLMTFVWEDIEDVLEFASKSSLPRPWYLLYMNFTISLHIAENHLFGSTRLGSYKGSCSSTKTNFNWSHIPMWIDQYSFNYTEVMPASYGQINWRTQPQW